MNWAWTACFFYFLLLIFFYFFKGCSWAGAKHGSTRFRPGLGLKIGLINKWVELVVESLKLSPARICCTLSWLWIYKKKQVKIYEKVIEKASPARFSLTDWLMDGLGREMLQPCLSPIWPVLRWAEPEYTSARPINTPRFFKICLKG